ncbi:hypothetical protein HYT33_00415 [Candidatus Roizmanbacteria bacterium]|nr:hypothetical protein [Candidatus Roizmanbacteria bacterium]
MDFTPSLKAKKFYRFTGPPEHWLTAIKYNTWGLERKLETRWKEIQTGDIFFIHSTGPNSSLFNNAASGIIGIGLIGSNFSIKTGLLWLREQKERKNIWPLLVPVSDFYLFSEIPPPVSWKNPDLINFRNTSLLIDLLLKNCIPLRRINGFPQMGSFSLVSNDVAQQILFNKRLLYVYEGAAEENIITSKPTKLAEVKSASETLRYATTLEVFNEIKPRIIKKSATTFAKDNELLSRAEISHATILQRLIEIFRSKGYETRSNRFVDLFAHNQERSFLIEVKSTENRNFRVQARKGVLQLFEYDYFEVNRFINEAQLKLKERYKILITSQIPEDQRYVKFINYLKIGVGIVDKKLQPIGADMGFSRI